MFSFKSLKLNTVNARSGITIKNSNHNMCCYVSFFLYNNTFFRRYKRYNNNGYTQ